MTAISSVNRGLLTVLLSLAVTFQAPLALAADAARALRGFRMSGWAKVGC
jgi:hypothetical protein